MHEIAFCDRKFVQNNLVKGAASQNGRAWLLLISLPADSTTVIAWSKYKYYFVIPGTLPVIRRLDRRISFTYQ